MKHDEDIFCVLVPAPAFASQVNQSYNVLSCAQSYPFSISKTFKFAKPLKPVSLLLYDLMGISLY